VAKPKDQREADQEFDRSADPGEEPGVGHFQICEIADIAAHVHELTPRAREEEPAQQHAADQQ
jgi:hypothetical protein